jgi:pimeloyl-ACP methyl ester carboxylesterase
MKRREFIRLVGGAALGPEGMMAYQETFVQRDQHRIYVRDHPGTEPAIILMHGFPDNVHLYDRLSPYLSPLRRVVLFDFLGWGSSDKPSGYPYTTDNQVGDLDAVITQLALGQVILVAHDASGPPAIDWALAHAERVAGLVLLNTYYCEGKAAFCGGRGGKGLNQGKQSAGGRGSDTAPSRHVEPIDGCASDRPRSQAASRPTFDPREEPGALAAHAGICAWGEE